MQLEVILPLVAYLVVVFGISVYAMRCLLDCAGRW